jgi:cytochrome b561
LLLVVLRLLAKRLSPRPESVHRQGLVLWLQSAARAGHVVLYLFMAIMPIAGWLVLSAAGKPIPFFWLGTASADCT